MHHPHVFVVQCVFVIKILMARTDAHACIDYLLCMCMHDKQASY